MFEAATQHAESLPSFDHDELERMKDSPYYCSNDDSGNILEMRTRSIVDRRRNLITVMMETSVWFRLVGIVNITSHLPHVRD